MLVMHSCCNEKIERILLLLVDFSETFCLKCGGCVMVCLLFGVVFYGFLVVVCGVGSGGSTEKQE
jgi:hypothetical protein